MEFFDRTVGVLQHTLQRKEHGQAGVVHVLFMHPDFRFRQRRGKFGKAVHMVVMPVSQENILDFQPMGVHIRENPARISAGVDYRAELLFPFLHNIAVRPQLAHVQAGNPQQLFAFVRGQCAGFILGRL